MEIITIVLLILSLVFLAVILVTLKKRSGSVTGELNFDNLLQEMKKELDRTSERLIFNLRQFIESNQQSIEGRLDAFKMSLDGNAQLSRQDSANSQEKLETSLTASLRKLEDSMRAFTESTDSKQIQIREVLQAELEKLRKENEAKLEQMRATVDEKLQGTLEKRLGESFKTVSDQLKQVYEGLGEMQTLASGVGDLKRVLTNVKNRGGWGEVQLERQLADMLSPQQYAKNVIINPETRESVEFAIVLPGRVEGEPVYLPIDAKFPQEDYERLLGAQETGSPEDFEKAGKDLEKAIKLQAKNISEKYIFPPFSTDFAIMYLPTEGLFAEVIRRPGLCHEIQNSMRVLITGPTTLMAILNSLEMGFRTLAVEKRTSDVFRILASAQTEFKKYGGVWEKLERQLNTAQSTVRDARIATKRVERELNKAEFSNSLEVDDVLELDALLSSNDDPSSEDLN